MNLTGFSCLAIDTASDAPNVAACRGNTVAARDVDDGGRTEQIYRYIDEVLAETDLELAALDCVAVGRGPGSFTGLRVGMAAAQALAFGAAVPVCPISSLAVLGFGAARRTGAERVVAALDARMGEVYAGGYRAGADDIENLDADCVTPPGALVVSGTGRFLAAGPGWAVFPELASRFAARIEAIDPAARPRAADLLVLARAAFHRGELVAPADALPLYLRDRVTG